MPWESATLPWVTVVFHGPAFSDTEKDSAAMDVLLDLHFGETSELYKRLVEQEQKVDALFTDNPRTADPELSGVYARVKKVEDLVVRSRRDPEDLRRGARTEAVPAKRLADAKSNLRYSLRPLARQHGARSPRRSPASCGMTGLSTRSTRPTGSTRPLTPEDLLAAGRKYFSDNRLVVTTLSHEKLPETIGKPASLAALAPRPPAPAAAGTGKELVRIESPLPHVVVKLLFPVGSAARPEGQGRTRATRRRRW